MADRSPIRVGYARGGIHEDKYKRLPNALPGGTMSLLTAVVILPTPACGEGDHSPASPGGRRALGHPPRTWPRSVMRIPFKTETDAFRVAVALALVAGASVLVGWVASRAYGVVVFAAGIAAGVTFELAGRETNRGSALRDAADAPHPHGASGGRRHILVVASEKLAGEELRRELAAAGGAVELDVLAPMLASRSHYWASDVDREREEARERLQASLAWAAEQGFAAKGEVADPDPLVAIEDELRDFGADEVIIVTHPRERASWLARRMLGHLERELDVPVREIVVADDDARSPAPRPPPTG